MRKYEVARLLARKYGLSEYLEIATPMTGKTFSRVDASQFRRRVRLLYRCRPDARREFDTDILSCEPSARSALEALADAGERFDLVFVDPWHTYAESRLNIEYALRLLKDDGIVLVHDCDPRHSDLVSPEYRGYGDWCGYTFAAYLDLVLDAPDLHYYTVDCDIGCGVIGKTSLPALFEFDGDSDLSASWRELDVARQHDFLRTHRKALLRLVSPLRFRLRASSGERRRPTSPPANMDVAGEISRFVAAGHGLGTRSRSPEDATGV